MSVHVLFVGSHILFMGVHASYVVAHVLYMVAQTWGKLHALLGDQAFQMGDHETLWASTNMAGMSHI